MTFENLQYEVRDRVLFLTIDRPKVLNALNAATIGELEAAFAQAKEDDDIGAVLLKGGGDRSFVAGADISELESLDPIQAKTTATRGQALTSQIESLGKPVAAAIQGFALGGGLGLAMACTFRTAAKQAKVGLPEVTLGVIPGYGGTQRLPRLVGLGKALELILTGDMIEADEAYRIGLVNHVYESEDLIPKTEEILRRILKRGPLAVRYAIEAAHRGHEMPLADGLNLEATLFGLLASSSDMKEGMRAFLEKRKATFEGR